jgi:hypothetical protein
MAITNTRLTTTDPTRVFQAAGQEVVTAIYICNNTGNTVYVDVYLINSDDSTAGSEDNIIYSQLELTANETYVISTERLILDASDEIECEASVANQITVTVSSYAM